ncbi:MAG TPA: CoA transferase, partial [Candidatus Binataceae bacterium]|nr:CoA transferase [Candidatus Binataceae bacterium]
LAGAPGRRMEPFLHEIPGLERSLAWHALNRNKRSITLDMQTRDSRALLAMLLEKFDIAFDAATNGVAPLDDCTLPEKLVRIRIAPFAMDGPKGAYAASDLTVMAASGAPGVTGDPDRAPLFFPVPQAMMEAGSDAAIAALAGLVARDRDGLGQSGRVSARVAAMMSAMSQHLGPPSGNPETRRTYGALTFAGVQIPSIYECADGFVMISVAFGPVFGQMTQRLAKWAADENQLARNIAEISWPQFIGDLQQKKVTPADLAALIEGLKSLARSKTKAEFGAASRKLGLLASPVFSMNDVAESVQYRERGLFTRVAVDGLEIDVPSRFAQFSNFAIETHRPAPRLSEHTVEILENDLDLTRIEIQALFAHGVI